MRPKRGIRYRVVDDLRERGHGGNRRGRFVIGRLPDAAPDEIFHLLSSQRGAPVLRDSKIFVTLKAGAGSVVVIVPRGILRSWTLGALRARSGEISSIQCFSFVR